MTEVKELSAQEVFDRAVARLKEMKARAGNPYTNDCLYRSENGPCLVGMFIPENLYSRDFEGEPARELPDEVLPGVSKFKHSLLSALQEQIHDERSNWGPDGFENWGIVARVAGYYGLKFEAPTA